MAHMDDQSKALRQIIGECDSLLFHTRTNMPYRGLDSSALRDGIEIIRKLAAHAVERPKERRQDLDYHRRR